MYGSIVKPFFDRFFALVLIILLSPVIAIIALLLTLYNRGTPFFLQQRPGYRAKPFYIIKFKTMRDAFDSKGKALPNQLRITTFGKKVRAWSLDELLQLINVLKGDMSFVGPRPLLMQYLELYNEEQAKRHEVKPGLTGWAQVNGRNALTWGEQLELDVYYVENKSLVLDLTILRLTFLKLLKPSKQETKMREAFNGKN